MPAVAAIENPVLLFLIITTIIITVIAIIIIVIIIIIVVIVAISATYFRIWGLEANQGSIGDFARL